MSAMISTRSRATGALAALALISACESHVPETAVDGLGYVEAVRMGSLDGPDAFPATPMGLVATEAEELVVLTSSQGAEARPFVFDAEGGFSRRLGGSGQGPGEFSAAMVGRALPGDSLLIHDLRQSRATVFTPEGNVARMIQVGGQVTQLIPLSWPDTVMAVMWPFGRPGQWYALMSFAGSEAQSLREFGSPFPTDYETMVNMRRFSAVSEEGTVWTIDNRAYELREWTSSGDSAGVVRPDSDWFARPGQGFGPDSIPFTHIVAVQHLGGDTVAVGLSVAKEGWEEAWIGVDMSGPEVRPPDASELWEGVIELRRGSDGTLLGSQRLEGVIVAILPDSRVATYRVEAPGYPIMSVFSRSTPEDSR